MRVYYKKQGTKTNWHIRWFPRKKKWVFDWRGLQNDDVCAAIGSGDVPNPTRVTKVWKVYDKDLNKWVKDDQIKVRVTSLIFVFVGNLNIIGLACSK